MLCSKIVNTFFGVGCCFIKNDCSEILVDIVNLICTKSFFLFLPRLRSQYINVVIVLFPSFSVLFFI